MSIVPLHKVTLCGLTAEKGAILAALQTLGCVHLQPLRPSPRAAEAIPPARAEDARKALRYLTDTPYKRRQITAAMLDVGTPFDVQGGRAFDMSALISQILNLQQREREAGDRRDFLSQRIRQLEPWGDFTLPPEADLAGYKFWFYLVPLNLLRRLPRKELAWQVVHKDNRDAYVAVIAKHEPAPDALPVPRVHTGSVALNELHRQLYRTEIEYEEIAAERQALTRWILLLSRNLDRAEDKAALDRAAAQTLDGGQVFAVQGWLARDNTAALRDFAARHKLALLTQAPEAGDSPPTLLHNTPALAAGEDIVRFYQTPAYGSWDPSNILFFSFTLFFAMILSDAGYGLLLAVALLAGWRKLGRSAGGQRLRRLGVALVGATLFWGVLAGSYFGLEPPADSLPGALKLLDLRDFDSMMQLSIIIGAAHIGLANLAMAWHCRGGPAAFAKLGWVAATLGGLLMWLGEKSPGTASAEAVFPAVGVGLLGAGLLSVFLFSCLAAARGAANGNGFKLWLRQLLAGLKELTGVSRIFGDVLSYLRLFALGLASASLALTFNQLAAQVQHAVPGIGFLLSLLVLVLGHGLNLVLAVVSGVVHGLRLNFIEFYNWGLAGEGYPFRAFAKTETTEGLRIKNDDQGKE